jgi:DNA topoisomerase I
MIIHREKVNEAKKIYKYTANNKIIDDKKILNYIESLVIPPAYDDVEIFYEKSPKILFQGLDKNKRLQQIYSKKWRESADKAKFAALIDFGRKLPAITLEILKQLKSPYLTKEKIIAVILRTIQLCGFRIGQLKYYDLYGSIGLVTLMKKHLKFKPNGLHIEFIGKKNVLNECIITDQILIKEIEKFAVLKKNSEFLFTYDQDKETKVINAIDINNWLKKYNKDFTTKFFRTYSVNITFIEIIRKLANENKFTSVTVAQRKKVVVNVIKELACSINNTPSICKKSYIDPKLIELFIEHPYKYEKEMIKSNNANLAFVIFLEKTY